MGSLSNWPLYVNAISIDFLDDLKCPSVWAGSSLESREGIHKVDIDDFQAAFDLTQKLIDGGAQRIAFMVDTLTL